MLKQRREASVLTWAQGPQEGKMVSEPSLLEASSLISGRPQSRIFSLHQFISPLCPRRACLWRPWLSSTNDQSRQVRKPVHLVNLSPCSTGSHACAAMCLHPDQVPSQRAPDPRAADLGKHLHSLAPFNSHNGCGRRAALKLLW